jgi:hypothetical protein
VLGWGPGIGVGPHTRLMVERAASAVWNPWARAKIVRIAEWVPSLRALVIP